MMPWLSTELDQLQQKKIWRQQHLLASPQAVHVIVDNQARVNFSSNDYLGLANHPQIKTAFKNAVDHYGVGSGASHLISGHSQAHAQLEARLAAWLGYPRVLLFSTGYMANLAVMSAFLGRRDGVFQDKLNHASLLDGARLSGASLYRFRHNDAPHLAELLIAKASMNKKIIATEGVFSMEGDCAPLKALSVLAKAHDAVLYVDDAHGLGCYGEAGRGSVQAAGLTHEDVPILMGTFGKALGTAGAFVASSNDCIEWLLQKARPYIYTTAMPPAMAAATLESLCIIQKETWRREKLAENIAFFRETAAAEGVLLHASETAIQSVVLGDSETATAVGEKLWQAGFWVGVIRPPTVPLGTARLRVSLSTEHTCDHIKALLANLVHAL